MGGSMKKIKYRNVRQYFLIGEYSRKQGRAELPVHHRGMQAYLGQ